MPYSECGSLCKLTQTHASVIHVRIVLISFRGADPLEPLPNSVGRILLVISNSVHMIYSRH